MPHHVPLWFLLTLCFMLYYDCSGEEIHIDMLILKSLVTLFWSSNLEDHLDIILLIFKD